MQPLIQRFMRFFFHHFYHTFAWTYDFVAALVSIGRWMDWVKAALPYIQGEKILEIGFGPGHLQKILNQSKNPSAVGRRPVIYGADESRQMIAITRDRLERAGVRQVRLTRSMAQYLPFPSESFDTVVSTFPAEFIFDLKTLTGVYRILKKSGVFVILPAAWITGRKFLDRLAALLFRVTGEAPRNIMDIITHRAIRPLEQAGFQVEMQQLDIRASLVVVLIARK